MITDGGGGLHTWDVTYSQFEVFWYYGTVSQLTYYVSVGLIKISITLFIRRLVDKSHARWKALTADIFLATLIVYVLLAIFWSVFSCTDRPAASFSIRHAGILATPARLYPRLGYEHHTCGTAGSAALQPDCDPLDGAYGRV